MNLLDKTFIVSENDILVTDLYRWCLYPIHISNYGSFLAGCYS